MEQTLLKLVKWNNDLLVSRLLNIKIYDYHGTVEQILLFISHFCFKIGLPFTARLWARY